MNKIINVSREVFGTCREAKENFHFDQLVKKYDRHTAEMLIKSQLEDSGITIEEFRTYKEVKGIIQNGKLDVSKAHKEAQQATCDALTLDS